MANKITVMKLTLARQAAAAGVDYSARHGAECPWCGGKTKIVTTRPWEDRLRIRFHRCVQGGCALAAMEVAIKSVEVDMVERSAGIGK